MKEKWKQGLPNLKIAVRNILRNLYNHPHPFFSYLVIMVLCDDLSFHGAASETRLFLHAAIGVHYLALFMFAGIFSPGHW